MSIPSIPIEELIAILRASVEKDDDDIAAEDARALFNWLDKHAGEKWLEVSRGRRRL